MSGHRKITGQERRIEFAVGLFFVAAMAILATYTVILNKDSFGSANYSIAIEFPYINTLQEGDRVLLQGVNVGRITGLDLDADGEGVSVEAIPHRAVSFYRDYSVEIRSSSIVGGRYIYINPGTRDAGAVAAGERLAGAPPIDLVGEAGVLVRNLKQEESEFREFLTSSDLFAKLTGIVDSIHEVSQKIRNGEGTLGRMVADETLFTETKDSIRSLRSVAQKIEGVLDGSRDAADSLRSAGEAVRHAAESLDNVIVGVHEGKGSIGKLITDDTLYDEAKSTITDLRSVSENIANPRSSVGKLLNDNGEFYDSMKQSFESMEESFDIGREIALKIQHGEGTIGKLIQDDALYDSAKGTVDQVRDAVTDFREQAPISTFGSFIFGAL